MKEPDRKKLSQRAQRRERGEPSEQQNPIPWPFAIAALLIIVWAFSYFYFRTGSLIGAGDMRTPVVATTEASVDGQAVFSANCAACHQSMGQGLPGVFPPLDGSGWVVGNPEVPVQILLHGINGKLTVNDVVYQGVMPSFSTKSDAEIAAVVTYIRQSWSNQASAVDAGLVAKQRELTAERDSPWAGGAELREAIGGPQ